MLIAAIFTASQELMFKQNLQLARNDIAVVGLLTAELKHLSWQYIYETETVIVAIVTASLEDLSKAYLS